MRPGRSHLSRSVHHSSPPCPPGADSPDAPRTRARRGTLSSSGPSAIPQRPPCRHACRICFVNQTAACRRPDDAVAAAGPGTPCTSKTWNILGSGSGLEVDISNPSATPLARVLAPALTLALTIPLTTPTTSKTWNTSNPDPGPNRKPNSNPNPTPTRHAGGQLRAAREGSTLPLQVVNFEWPRWSSRPQS